MKLSKKGLEKFLISPKKLPILIAVLLVLMLIPAANAGWLDWLTGIFSPPSPEAPEEEVFEYAAADYVEANLNLQGNTHKIQSDSDIDSDNFDIKVDMDADNVITSYSVDFVDDEDDAISKSSYFFCKDYGVLQYRGADATTKSSPKIKFKDIKNGNTLDYALPVSSSTNVLDTSFNLQGNTHKVMSHSDPNQDDFSIKVDMDGDNSIGTYSDQYGFISSELSPIPKNHHFFLKDYGVIRYVGSDAGTAANPKIRFFDLKTSNNMEYAISPCTVQTNVTLNLQGNSHKVQSASDINQDDFTVKVDLDGDNTIGSFTINQIFITSESSIVSKNNYFFLPGYGVIQYKGADKISDTSPKIKFKDIKTGNTLEYAVPPTITNNFVTNILLGGNTFRVENATSAASDDFLLKIDMDHSSTIGDYILNGVVIMSESNILNKNDYAFINNYGLVQYRGADNLQKTSPKIRFKDEQTGNNIDLALPVSTCTGSNIGVNINLGGNTYQIDALYTSTSDFQINADMDHSGTIGDYSIIVKFTETNIINKNEYFMIKDYGILKYRGADNLQKTSPKMSFYDERAKSNIDLALPSSTGSSSSVLLSINLGGNTYDVVSKSVTTSDDFQIAVDMDHSNTIGDYQITVIDNEANTISQNNHFFIKDYGILKYISSDNANQASPKLRLRDEQINNNIDLSYQVITPSPVPPTPTPPSPQPPPPAPTPVPTPQPTCTGCLVNGNCISYGIRIGNQYCDIDNSMKNQKPDLAVCSNNYECQTNLCLNNQCFSQSFFNRMFSWFRRWFG